MPLHTGKGRSVGKAIADIIDYAENPKKTDDGKLIIGYACDTRVADAEFALSKRQYAALTGRIRGADDVIAYHTRQSFVPGEITPEEAGRIGYELAMSLTKGNNAFIVCTHTDKAHIHNHIIFNSTTIDCTRKFRNFWGSSWALRRINDKLCLDNGLSVVEDPRPSRGHYGTWLGDKKPLSFQDRIRRKIDEALEKKPASFGDFLLLMEADGVMTCTDGKHLKFRLPEQQKNTRADTLKGDYTEAAIRERIAGKRAAPTPAARAGKERIGLLIDIEAVVRSGKGPGYERWAKVYNIKQLSRAVIFLKENGDMSYEELAGKASDATERFGELTGQVKELEAQMKANAALQKNIVNYVKTRDVYAEYRKAGYSKKFRSAHEDEILIHQAAKKSFDELKAKKLPTVASLREVYSKLLAEKKTAYTAYKEARAKMRELQNVKANVDYLLGTPEVKRTRQIARE
jgi:hypothetical protein